jgi:UDP-2,3-diacylglucosamine hydrolase
VKHHSLFIADLHLSLDKPQYTQRFLQFLRQRAPQAAALYILGDLFDAWVGDDDWTPPTRSIRLALKTLTDSGTAVYLQTGNRDFLLGAGFAQDTGVQLLGDYAVIDFQGVNTLLTHGDLLCTDDLPYQQFRLKAHDPAWQQNILAKPLLLRLLAARWYRLRSYWHKRNKTQDIMDVNQDTVVQVMRAHGVTRLIHGHTHRPTVHDFELDGQAAQRIVLPDWRPEQLQVLCWGAAGFEVQAV